MHYKYVHFNSHDKRGIDVALIYGEQFTPFYSSIFSIVNEHGEQINTRDILYVKGFLGADTIHIFVNHWTSRYRGLLESNALRMAFSELLKSKTDSILELFPDANIIVMGDFNDQPKDESIKNLTTDGKLIGLVATPLMNNVSGTMKYKEEWYIFDQIFVTKSLLSSSGIGVNNEGLRIFDIPFILEEDTKYLGNKPYRTNLGFRYHGGFSDHLPIFLDLNIK
jgi:endonuclease/exonuclease/phosphatase family metal-dependent hydrolase